MALNDSRSHKLWGGGRWSKWELRALRLWLAGSQSPHVGYTGAVPLPLPRPHQLVQFKQLLMGGGQHSPHALRHRSWASLGCAFVAGVSAAAERTQGISMPQECCFQRQSGDRVITTVWGMPLPLQQWQLQVKGSYLQWVLVDMWTSIGGKF